MKLEWNKLSEKELKIITEYCENDMKLLKRILHKSIDFKSIPGMYRDDVYGNAMILLVDCAKKYDETKNCRFDTFFSNCAKLRSKTWTRNRTRAKRCNVAKDKNGNLLKDEDGNNVVIPDTSIHTEIEDGSTLEDVIKSDYNLEDQVLKTQDCISEKTKVYIDSLGTTQRKIAHYLMDDYKPDEIKMLLGLSDKEYNLCLSDMRSYEKKKNLVRDLNANDNNKDILKESSEMSTLISEKTKDTSYSLASISKKLRSYQIRDNHVLQRSSGQWNSKTKSELISDILQGRALTQIIISEEIKNGVQMLWLIDGKQRCTNIDDYLHDGFSISKNVKIQEIPYQTQKLDENGNVMLNEEGFPIPEIKIFNIVGKKFSQLPEELQDKFKDYQLPVMLNLNCDKRDIAYDISRFNRCRPMNKAQNGWTGFDEDYAELVDNILKMDFFKPDCPKSSYTITNEKNGALRRMIVEAVMVSEYIEDFQRDFVRNCEFLTDNANENLFIDIYEDIDNLTDVLTEETAELFNAKNTFLWFGLYNRFKTLNLEISKFSDFMCEFKNSLHNVVIGEYSFESLEQKNATKDKSIIKKKMNVLEKLMYDYFDIEKIEEATKEIEKESDEMQVISYECEDLSVLKFVQEMVDENITDGDIEVYEDSLIDYTVEIPHDSKILDTQNMKSMIAICAYSYQMDEDLDKWLIDYVERHDDYAIDQKQNFTYMKNDFNEFFGIYNEKNIA